MDFAQYLKQQTSFLFIMKKYVTEYANYLNNNQLTKLYIQAHSRINKAKKPNFSKFLSRHNEAKDSNKKASSKDAVQSLHHVNSSGFAFGYDLLNNKQVKNSGSNTEKINMGDIKNNTKASSQKTFKRVKRNPNGLYIYALPSSVSSFKAHLVTPDDLIAYLNSPKNIEHYLDY